MYDFSSGRKVRDFTTALKRAFPFFRMFLDDALDAEVALFLQTMQADEDCLEQLHEALAQALNRITIRYPGAVPPDIKTDIGYEIEDTFLRGVSSIIQTLIHLQGTISAFRKVVYYGGNPTTL